MTRPPFGQVSAAITEMSEANKDLLEKYRKEVALRRKYHEQLVELKGRSGEVRRSRRRTREEPARVFAGNIRVLCRVKPVLKQDQQHHDEGQPVVAVTADPNNESSLSLLNKGKVRVFEMDKVFHPQATQEEVRGGGAHGQGREVVTTSGTDGFGSLRCFRRSSLW